MIETQYMILLLSFLVLGGYLLRDKWISWAMFWTFIAGLAAFVLRISFYSEIGTKMFDFDNFWQAGLQYLIATVVFGITAYISKVTLSGRRLKRFMWGIFLGYIWFGLLQQVIFKFIFFETLLTVVEFPWQAIVISSAYYAFFHIKFKWFKDFVIWAFVIDLVWSYIYMSNGNIFLLALSHAILGALYVSIMHEDLISRGDFVGMTKVAEKVEAKGRQILSIR